MKYCVLALIPLALGLFHLVLFFVLSDSTYTPFVFNEVIVVKMLGFLGCLAVALKFGKGDYPRRAWTLVGLSLLLFAVNDIFFRSIVPKLLGDSLANAVSGFVVAVGNVSFILGGVILARTWASIGFTFPGRPWARWLLYGAAIAVTLVLVGPSVILGLRNTLDGNFTMWEVVTDMVSGLGDLIILSLIGPILLIALSLRGGVVRWPWIFLTLVLAGWLLFDGVNSWYATFGLTDRQHLWLREFFRILACLYTMSAALAQLHVMRDLNKEGATPA
ncbi:MAG: hypothetical protein AB1714_06815 [Acidobacteriota bacterium]